MVGTTEVGSKYGGFAAFIFVFNLVVGAGSLALPHAFIDAGFLLAMCFLGLMAFLSYMTVTWVVESMAATNALLALQEARQKEVSQDVEPEEEIGRHRLPGSLFSIDRRTELGLMSELFFGKAGRYFFYVIMVLYLYGDLAIYAVAVPVTMAKVSGDSFHIGSVHITDSYRFFVALFAVLVCPWCFFNIQGTKWFQVCTLMTRNVAFFTMIAVALIYISNGHGTTASHLKTFEPRGLPTLFGTAVYSFMCHHSLPSIVSPVADKSTLTRLLAVDYFAIFVAYAGLCMSAVFAYGAVQATSCTGGVEECNIQSLYTLNFEGYHVKFVADYLTLFPVFTLTTNFPLIAVTLRNNLQTLYMSLRGYSLSSTLMTPKAVQGDSTSLPPVVAGGSADSPVNAVVLEVVAAEPPYAPTWVFACCAIIPPLIIAFNTQNVDSLVDITGSFAGMFIQFVLPATLVHAVRNHPDLMKYYQPEHSSAAVANFSGSHDSASYGAVSAEPVDDVVQVNQHRSPFSHRYWVYAVWGVSVVTFAMAIYNQATK